MTLSACSSPLLALVASPDPLTHKQLWRALPTTERRHAAVQLLADTESPWARPALVEYLARVNKGFRRPTIAKWSNDKIADEIGRKPLDEVPLIDTLLKALHFPERAPLQAAFFDAVGIAHTDGSIEADELPMPAAEPTVVAAGVATLLQSHPGDEALFYLLCIATLEPGAWPTLRTALREMLPTS